MFKKINKKNMNVNFNYANLFTGICLVCMCTCDMAYKAASHYRENAINDASMNPLG